MPASSSWVRATSRNVDCAYVPLVLIVYVNHQQEHSLQLYIVRAAFQGQLMDLNKKHRLYHFLKSHSKRQAIAISVWHIP